MGATSSGAPAYSVWKRSRGGRWTRPVPGRQRFLDLDGAEQCARLCAGRDRLSLYPVVDIATGRIVSAWYDDYVWGGVRKMREWEGELLSKHVEGVPSGPRP